MECKCWVKTVGKLLLKLYLRRENVGY